MDPQEQLLARLKRALEREKLLRDETERMLEEKTRELFLAHEKLAETHARVLEAERRERGRLQEELEIARRIQESILPRSFVVPGYELAARMIPCSEIGGDYYDVIPIEDGSWIAIADVAGHGLTAGLVAMMLQCVLSAFSKHGAELPPSTVLALANTVLFENVRERIGSDEHVTASLLRVRNSGRVDFAGAHEDILLWRGKTQTVEQIRTVGTWLGMRRNISSVTDDLSFQLEPEDLLVLYTDGLTEANGTGGRFGIERLREAVARQPRASVETIRDAVLDEVASWSPAIDDDRTLLVSRYKGTPAAG